MRLEALPEPLVTRFAPAPTGHLHIGHVVNALFVWGIARQHGGRVLLRIEDHDRQRARAGYERSIVDDLAWLGFEAYAPMVRQSERGEVYERALERLRARGLTYACECSRREISASNTAAFPPAPELRYPGTCAGKRLDERPGRGIRVRLPRSEECFEDLRLGPQAQVPSEHCGDLLVRDRTGSWTYQFAVTVDDMEQGITLVVRGMDLLASTGRQLQLARLLGRSEPPRYFHHPLVFKSPGQKLSKSDRDTGIREMRAAGLRADDVLTLARQHVPAELLSLTS